MLSVCGPMVCGNTLLLLIDESAESRARAGARERARMQKKYVTIFLKWRTRRLPENKVTFFVYRLWCCKDAEMERKSRGGDKESTAEMPPKRKGKAQVFGPRLQPLYASANVMRSTRHSCTPSNAFFFSHIQDREILFSWQSFMCKICVYLRPKSVFSVSPCLCGVFFGWRINQLKFPRLNSSMR